MFFAVFDFGGDASHVTSVVGLTPSKSWRKGERFSERGGVHTHDRWVFSSPAPAGAEPEEKLVELVGALEEVAPGVRSAAEQFSAGILCAMYTEQPNPGLHLSAEILEQIAALKLSFDLDTYALGEE